MSAFTYPVTIEEVRAARERISAYLPRTAPAIVRDPRRSDRKRQQGADATSLLIRTTHNLAE